ncbi:GNAT family N-acetyltransferase [Seonamhaeicola marinus]|uniref:GNAT family N-acetyltransferase n=1 Tax=Seonamhaeicola marinus TaxID=1912246 RepID=A0A5D0ILM8_9FLAO|nr:GNAT family N-acetyltransferase [Seonamhaeicola marinus]TYA84426.1 GNAT family N-acetyltransferase [Seonamhaeicola marinus]
MEIIIRNAEIIDSESITELSNQLGYKAENTDIQNRLKEILGHSDNCIYVAIENEKVVGWIHGFYSIRVESDSFVEIGGLVVGEDYRKNGIGKKLVNRVIEWTKLKNYEKVRVRCNVIRKESHRFYEKIGFEINKEQKIFDKRLN